MKKRIIPAVLSVLILGSLLCGCKGGNEEDPGTGSTICTTAGDTVTEEHSSDTVIEETEDTAENTAVTETTEAATTVPETTETDAAKTTAEETTAKETTTRAETTAHAETTGKEPPRPTGKKVKVVILSGQSNMVGLSYHGFLYSSATSFPEERYFAFKAGYNNIQLYYDINPFKAGKQCSEKFVPVRLEKSGAISSSCFGPEIGMAERLSEAYPDETIYFIKAATEGSNLYNDWSISNHTASSLYTELVSTTKKALDLIAANGDTPEIVAFCWMQGEADSQNHWAAYNYNFNALIKYFCIDLKEYMPKNGMAVIQAGISTVWQSYQDLNAEKEKWAETSSKYYYFGTEDISEKHNNTDVCHFDAEPMVILGNRFGDKVIEAIKDLDKPEVRS